MSIKYPQNIATVVVAAYLLGATKFGENQPQENVLGQVFCYAVRNVLQEEIQGGDRSRMEIISALADQVRPQILPETYQAFCSLSQEEFESMFDAVISAANESELTLSELINGLSSVNQIMDEFLKHQH
jgi:hypothetical protein